MAAVEQDLADGGLEARQPSAGEFLSRGARSSYAQLVIGLVLFVVGVVTLSQAQGSADALARNGVHVTAIVTDNLPSFHGSEGILVSYPTPSGVETSVTVWVNDLASYRIGQPVEISYDPTDPARAVLTKGDSPNASIYLFIFFLGLTLILAALYSFLARWRRRRALPASA